MVKQTKEKMKKKHQHRWQFVELLEFRPIGEILLKPRGKFMCECGKLKIVAVK